ncbi:hypothetical protein QQ020_24780 [Fulvivirgaceae bacterium BMA12]|uniref:Toxin-antitoxin system YwqK family antitoxin n=1 Tax=Agaribacillus aureus TaxID=3051825 RepID=A0ABT8LCE9_9BACT|nr:hypothetical protein [Fulvivirgaceae bacterium BMA12]
MSITSKIWYLILALLSVIPCDIRRDYSSDLNRRTSGSFMVGADEVTVKGSKVFYLDSPFTGQVREYFPGGAIKSAINYRNGLKEGEALKFYEHGAIAERRYYHNNEKSGTHMGWWPSGVTRFKISYLNGLYHGKYEAWFKNGGRYKLFHYNAGEEAGSQQMWKENGTFRANFYVVRGRRFGLIGLKQCKSVENEY